MNPYVLVVESDPDLQKRIGDALREARYELSAETDLGWARRSLAVRKPDAVIVDTRLHDGSGFHLARELREQSDTRKTPIFFVASRYRGASHRSEAIRRFGPAEYLPVPLDVDTLLAALLLKVPPEVVERAPAARPSDEQATRRVDVKTIARAAARHRTPPVETVERRRPASPPAPAPIIDEAQKKERREVERDARDIHGAGAEVRGSLKRTGFAAVLQRLYARKATGALLLLRADTKKIVFFADGYPVSVRSNVLSECLGEILVARKLISREVLAESLRRMKAEKKQQGAVLVEMGALSPYNLQRALVEQMEAKLFDLFSWRDGKFSFKDGGEAPKEALRLDRPTATLILDGIRRHYDAVRQDAVLTGFVGKYVALAADPVLRLQEMSSDPGELSFIYGLDGSLRLDKVLERAAIPHEKAKLLLVALAEARMIEPAVAPAARATDPRARVSASSARLPGDVGAGEKSREQLAAVLDTMLGQNHFDVLGVGPNAPAEDIAAAHDALARDYHPDRFRGKPDDVRRIAQEIFERLTEAHRVLGDPSRRKAYAARLDRARPRRDDGGTDPQGPNKAAEQIYRAGVEHLRVRRHHEAVDAFRQAARMVPEQASYRAALGWALFREAPADARAARASLAELKRAVQLDGKNFRARVYLGHFYAQTGRTDLAVDEFEVALRIKPGALEIEEELRRLKGNS